MIDELNRAVAEYQKKWDQMVAGRTDKVFFEGLKPNAIGWKVADAAEYKRCYEELHDTCDRVIETWMNGRWIAKMHLKDAALDNGVTIIKVMQRRPGSDDALGLDHHDYVSPPLKEVQAILEKEPDLKWSHEDNDVVADYNWISVWFDGTEAKMKPGTVLDIICKELQEINQKILGQ